MPAIGGREPLLFARALLAFTVLPGVVAFAVPLIWLRASAHTALVHPSGLAALLCGTIAAMDAIQQCVLFDLNAAVVVAVGF
jgi:hypothetical protein